MELEIVYRGMDPSIAMDKYVSKYFEKFKKYFGKEDPSSIFLRIILEGHFNHHMYMVEVHIKSEHFNIQIKRDGADMYPLIDQTMHIVEQDLQKNKQRRVDDLRRRKKCC